MLSSLFYIVNFSVSIISSIIALSIAFSILLTIIIDRHCRTIANLLICNTSVATILYFLLNLISVNYGLRNSWAYYQPACAFRAYSYTVLCAAICYSYSIQALSRLLFTVFYSHKYLQTWFIHWIMIAISWCISILTPIIPFFFKHGYQLEEESHLCVPTTKEFVTSMYSVVIAFIIPLNTVTIVYSLIFCYARQSTRRVRSFRIRRTVMMMPSHTAILKVKREIRLMRKILILIFLLLCGGMPYLILVIWHVTVKQRPPEAFYLLSTNLIPIFIALKMMALFCMCKQMKNKVLQYLRKLRRF